MNFEEAAKKVITFVGAMTGSTAKLIRLEKVSDGWLGYAEVYEESAFIKSIGLPSRVMDRNIYEVKLNPSLEVVAFARKTDSEVL
ncbi:MAG: hypothetical protein RMI34_01290 [Chloroherpetonaceae bacterium]|nr:hypothetical protein [Chloroherpetonaceae bacterium]MCS7211357.1 hypothetical protein [Chloroherpetonaceae bacterium]MDW8018692.1 hypothetical protein [Chloroherpetonaceae bacterium]MDW8466300.1 hypothetical protein [Chloroherpetonaceae bacterium]